MENHRLVGRLRLPKKTMLYWLNEIEEFADHNCGCSIKYLEFGKQDTRGAYSICWLDDADTVRIQKHFESKDMMLGFIQGYNYAKD